MIFIYRKLIRSLIMLTSLTSFLTREDGVCLIRFDLQFLHHAL